ncbi:hypothetical protein [Methanosphaera sp. WGK6]|uniref:hypothetical protein n=1 Tax=Methanosphaera sp. WGK6 TaxID=1561964 RepID=UPI00084C1C1B|nr:hypothetical protein [Methanosphaera sp. WGK6]OED30343.1 hypothetical protein NL43_02905 [Methanosphaera sp. WGK6]
MQTIMQNKHTQIQRRQQIYKINYQRLHYDANKLLNNKNIRNNIHNTAEINRIRRTTTQELTDIHGQVLDNQIRQTRNGIQRIKPESIIHDNMDHEKKIQDILDKRKKYIHNTNKRLEKNKDNRVKWRGERLKDTPAKYKVWKYTPNPRTRHACNDGQTMELEEKFIIQNCKTGQVDEMDYPGDWKGSLENTINCLCDLEFTNTPPTPISEEDKE